VPVDFKRGWDGSWRGSIGAIAVFADDATGQPNPSQAALAELLVSSLDAVKQRASNYLDLFVERGKVCGDPTEEWHLEEVEMRGLPPVPVPMCQFNFTLAGDDGGLWQVEMSLHGEIFSPLRFERRQG
jgi:hypothetical protein